MASEAAVRAAFAAQAGFCEALGSPFTARLCALAAERLDRTTAIGRRMLDWPGIPDSLHDAVPLRFCGGLHGLVRAGRLPALARLYPPGADPDPEPLWSAMAAALEEAGAELDRWLDSAPQTNEVARSGVLGAGLAVIAERTGLPLALSELGASAGLNLLPDRYDLRLGGSRYGDPSSEVRLAPAWSGGDPPAVALRIASRRGVDLNPLDASDPAHRARLPAYVWPDQSERLARLEAALLVAAAAPPPIDREDAASWVEREIGAAVPTAGIARVVMHSIAFQYFPKVSQDRIAAAMDEAGARATSSAPLAWLRYEVEPGLGTPTLRLRLWPGDETLLAQADPHGRTVTWLAA